MRVAVWGLGLLAICAAAQARADQRDPAAAQALFDEGMALMKARDYAKACSKLEESQRLDAGVGTQFHLADCYERVGRTASAWAGFLEVASMATASGQRDREQAARKRAARLESRLGRIRIVVPAPRRVAGLRVERDGIAVGSAQWDSALPADPGEHEVAVNAPGHRPFLAKINVQEGQTSEFEVPPLEAAPALNPPSSPPIPAPAPLTPPPPGMLAASTQPVIDAPPPPSPAGMGPVVIGLGALGLVGLGVGTTLGFMARSKYEDSKAECRALNEDLCNAQGVKLRDESITLANVSTIGFAAGGAALIGAGVVWWARSNSKPAVGQAGHLLTSVQVGPSQIVLLGRF